MKRPSLIAVVVLGGLLAFSTMALAQGQGQGRARRADATAQVDRLKTELKLDEKQTADVKALLEKQNKKTQELRQDTSLSQADRRTKTRELRDETTKEMKKILTADQFKKYEELQPQRGGQRQRRSGTGAQ